MPTRLALILALLAQQLWLPVLWSGRVTATDCGATSCCVTVETVSCCGTPIVEMVCGKAGGVCLCGLEPDRPDAPAPPPTADDPGKTLLASLSRLAQPCDLRPDAGLARRIGLDERCPTSHNTARALLGNWRT